jgi:RNA-directed DNA polymerase
MAEGRRSEHLRAAWTRVQANKGAPGVDGMTVDELAGSLRKAWPAIREQLRQATYVPAPVREGQLPKLGGGTRRLGIPPGLDRCMTQAILPGMSPLFDSGFSDHSDGFRPGRRAHQAVEQAGQSLAAGYRWVVDSDLEKFFDQVNHDRRMSRVAKQITDKRLLTLIRRDLTAGILQEGLVSQRDAGPPHGSPLSPLWSHILLESFDKALERRGHRFCRDADDANVYVRSQRAGERGLASLTHFLDGKRRLQVNRAKSAGDRPWKRKFLGDTVTHQRAPRLKPALESIQRAKARLRQLTHQGRGRNLRQVIQEINRFPRGWIGYFRLATGLHAVEVLDQWRRRRLRKILWEQWRTPKTRDRKLVALGVAAARARKATATGRGAWWNAGASPMHAAVTNRFLAEWGLLSLLDQRRAWQRST